MNFAHEELKRWFLQERRELPWRIHPSPYRVWVSEVMLQQTQATVVIPYFERWMQHFPTLQSLSQASEDEVIKIWEGLGYYSRARNLLAGAKMLASKIPSDVETLSKVKGLGPYTVAAILSFAFHQKAAPVDGNVVRVLSRYFAIVEEVTPAKIRPLAETILPVEEHWIHNEALIELGATICTKNPSCQKCPIRSSCKAFAKGLVHELPIISKKTQYEKIYRDVGVIVGSQGLLLTKCKNKGLMQGLHEFPYVERQDKSHKKAMMSLSKVVGLDLELIEVMPEVEHSFTRFRVHLRPFYASTLAKLTNSPYEWFPHEKLEQLAFSSGHRRILSYWLYKCKTALHL